MHNLTSMKRTMVLLSALFLTCLTITQGAARAQEASAQEESTGLDLPVDIAADFTYASYYYWRGLPGGVGSFAMPSLDISYSTDPVSVGANVWYGQGFEPDKDAGENSEVDYTIYAGLAAGPVEINLGAIDYAIPAAAPFADGYVLEVFAGAGINTLPFDNNVTVYMNVSGDDDNSVYIAPSIGYTYEDWTLGVVLGIVPGESALYGTTGTALISLTPGVSYSIPFGNTEAAVSLNLGYNPETGTKMPYFTFGTGFSL